MRGDRKNHFSTHKKRSIYHDNDSVISFKRCLWRGKAMIRKLLKAHSMPFAEGRGKYEFEGTANLLDHILHRYNNWVFNKQIAAGDIDDCRETEPCNGMRDRKSVV